MKALYNTIKLFTVPLLIILMIGCTETNNPSDNTKNQSATKQMSNSTAGSVSTDSGYELKVPAGAIPDTKSGQDASVTFSVEEISTPPKPLPGDLPISGKFIRFGPEGFVFAIPVKVMFPAKESDDISGLAIAYFNQGTEEWEIKPISEIDQVNFKVGTDVLQLGVFALVKPQRPGNTFAKKGNEILEGTCPSCDGGVKLNTPGTFGSGTYYALTIKSVIMKFPWGAAYYSNLVGNVAITPSNVTGSYPNHPLKWILPQGQYEFWVSALVPDGNTKKWNTYSVPIPVKVDRQVWWDSWSSPGNGYYNIEDNWVGGGTWLPQRPEGMPEPTKSVGTGDFQATLSWFNSSASNTDLDLHLFGPNNLHVYWELDKSTDGTIELDQDWIDDNGNAIENIYTVKSDFPKGNYRVEVNHYYGAIPKNFNVRIIRNGTVTTFSGKMTSIDQTIVISNFTL